MRYVDIYDLHPGEKLGESIRTSDGIELFPAERMLSSEDIGLLMSSGYPTVLIDDPRTDGICCQRIVSTSLEIAIIQALKKLQIEKVRYLAREMVAELLTKDCCLCDMPIVKSYENYTLQHSYAVGLYAAIVGLNAGLSVSQIEELACAGLLHDLGKVVIDTEIIDAPRPLTSEEYRVIQQHPANGYNLLKNNFELSNNIRSAVLEHHEQEDGSGYPLHKDGAKLHTYSKILHICDVYDALTSKRPYKERWPIPIALQYIQSHTNDMFSKKYSMVFMRCISPYPTGTTITLCNNERCTVVKNEKSDLQNPLVRILSSGTELYLKELGSPYFSDRVDFQNQIS